MDQRENLRRSRFLQQRGFNPAMVAKILRDSD
jgi:SOS response regulatory protein OraA/RecX